MSKCGWGAAEPSRWPGRSVGGDRPSAPREGAFRASCAAADRSIMATRCLLPSHSGRNHKWRETVAEEGGKGAGRGASCPCTSEALPLLQGRRARRARQLAVQRTQVTGQEGLTVPRPHEHSSRGARRMPPGGLCRAPGALAGAVPSVQAVGRTEVAAAAAGGACLTHHSAVRGLVSEECRAVPASQQGQCSGGGGGGVLRLPAGTGPLQQFHTRRRS